MRESIVRICCGPYDSLSYLLLSSKGSEAALIDAGPLAEELLKAIREAHAEVRYVLLTHVHFDHLVGLIDLSREIEVPAMAHPSDIEVLTDLWPAILGPPPDLTPLRGNLRVGDLEVEPIHTPGHTPGSVSYYVREMRVVFTGDTLFKGNIGRTDFKHGDPVLMERSLRKLMELDPSTSVLPGHGEPTTIGAELYNLEEYLRWLREG